MPLDSGRTAQGDTRRKSSLWIGPLRLTQLVVTASVRTDRIHAVFPSFPPASR